MNSAELKQVADHLLTKRRIDVEENAEKNRGNARLSVKTPTKNAEKMAYLWHTPQKNRISKPQAVQ